MSFTGQIDSFTRKAQTKLHNVISKLVIDMFSGVVMASPVDTGRFRGNWQPSIGRYDNNWLPIEDAGGNVTIGKIISIVPTFKLGDVIYLVNNLPYSREVEYIGWGKTPPYRPVGKTVARFDSYLSRLA